MWSSCCAGQNEDKKCCAIEQQSAVRDMAEEEEVAVLSGFSLKFESSGQGLKDYSSSDTGSTRENSRTTSFDSVSTTETTPVKVGVQVSEPSTSEAAKTKIGGRASKPLTGLEEHSTCIEVIVDKSQHGSLGWSVDQTNHDQLVIKDIVAHQSGAAVLRTQAAAYDRILSVNGLLGCSTELCLMLQDNMSLTIQLLRPKIIDVKLEEGDRKPGAVMQYAQDSLGCIIQEIHPGGFLATWNSLNPSRLVKPMDRIVSVNGRNASAPELAAMLKQGCATSVEVLRYPYP